jgi:hypothetical protein
MKLWLDEYFDNLIDPADLSVWFSGPGRDHDHQQTRKARGAPDQDNLPSAAFISSEIGEDSSKMTTVG